MSRIAVRASGQARRCALAALVFAVFVDVAHAAHPFISEDTATQGRGRFELELGSSLTRDSAGRVLEFGPQLSYGVRDELDAIVRLSIFSLSGEAVSDNGRDRGFGDAAIDVKWRFATIDRMSFGVRAGIDAATAANGIEGYGGTAYHALFIATANAAPLLITGDAGYRRAPATANARRDRYRVTVAGIYAVDERWKLGLNAATESHPDITRATWPGVVLIGAIATLTSWLDVDAGVQWRLNHVAPRQVFNLGATLRWQ